MFYQKFKQLCSQKGVSVNKAATDIGLSNSTATKWKKTGAVPDGSTISRAAEYFGVSADFLLSEDERSSGDVGNPVKRFFPAKIGFGDDEYLEKLLDDFFSAKRALYEYFLFECDPVVLLHAKDIPRDGKEGEVEDG